jgi:hypothetical protein
MNAVISFVEFENRAISAIYRNLMVGATVINSPAPNGSLRIRLPDAVKPGAYFLKALNGHGQHAAQSVEFYVS